MQIESTLSSILTGVEDAITGGSSTSTSSSTSSTSSQSASAVSISSAGASAAQSGSSEFDDLVSDVSSLAHSALYTAGHWLTEGVTLGGIVSLLA